MNIEDKYKTHFKDHEQEVDPQLWRNLSSELDKTNNSNYWWLAAACITIGLFFYSTNFNNTEVREIAATDTQTTISQKQIPVQIEKQEIAITTPVIIKKEKRIVVTKKLSSPIVALNTIALNEIVYPNESHTLIQRNTVFVRLKIKAAPVNRVNRKRFENPVEKLIDFAKVIVKKESKNIEFPTIEIDYKSLLTLNDN